MDIKRIGSQNFPKLLTQSCALATSRLETAHKRDVFVVPSSNHNHNYTDLDVLIRDNSKPVILNNVDKILELTKLEPQTTNQISAFFIVHELIKEREDIYIS